MKKINNKIIKKCSKNLQDQKILMTSTYKNHSKLKKNKNIIIKKNKIDEIKNNKKQSLLLAVENNNKNKIDFLIKNKYDLNIKNKNGNSALVIAALYNKKIEIVKLLLLNGCFIDVKNKELCVFFLNLAGIYCFNIKNFKNNLVNQEQFLEYLIKYGKYESEENLKMIFFMSYYKNCDNYFSQTVLMKSFKFFKSKIILQKLVKDEKNIDQADINGNTALIISIKTLNIEGFNLLINSKININKSNNDKETPLIISILTYFKKVVFLKEEDSKIEKIISKLLKQKNIKKNKLTNYDLNALMLAVLLNNDLKILKKLIKSGAKINKVNSRGNNSLMLSVKRLKNQKISKLIKKGIDILHRHRNKDGIDIKIKRNIKIVDFLIKNKIDLNHKNNQGNNALMLAVKNKGNFEIVKLLIEKGIFINEFNLNGENALMLAVKYRGNFEIVKLLVEKGIFINEVNKNEENALNLALDQNFENNDDIIYFLLRNNVEVYLKNYFFNEFLKLILVSKNSFCVLKKMIFLAKFSFSDFFLFIDEGNLRESYVKSCFYRELEDIRVIIFGMIKNYEKIDSFGWNIFFYKNYFLKKKTLEFIQIFSN